MMIEHFEFEKAVEKHEREIKKRATELIEKGYAPWNAIEKAARERRSHDK